MLFIHEFVCILKLCLWRVFVPLFLHCVRKNGIYDARWVGVVCVYLSTISPAWLGSVHISLSCHFILFFCCCCCLFHFLLPLLCCSVFYDCFCSTQRRMLIFLFVYSVSSMAIEELKNASIFCIFFCLFALLLVHNI